MQGQLPHERLQLHLRILLRHRIVLHQLLMCDRQHRRCMHHHLSVRFALNRPSELREGSLPVCLLRWRRLHQQHRLHLRNVQHHLPRNGNRRHLLYYCLSMQLWTVLQNDERNFIYLSKHHRSRRRLLLPHSMLSWNHLLR